MRDVWHALLVVLSMALGGASLLWGLPWAIELTVRPAHHGVPPGDVGPGWRVVRAEVTQTYRGITGLAVGDRVQFDRYGVLAPAQGSVLCVWMMPGSREPEVAVTPLGGRVTHAGALQITPDALPAGCPESPSAGAVVSVNR